jgi:ribosomal-protein-alanine N-acetyltransferase
MVDTAPDADSTTDRDADADSVTEVRRAVSTDSAALRRLQRVLDEPAPELLDAALTGVVGDLFVAVAADGEPVGYLLVVESPPSALDPPLGPDGGSSAHIAELVVAPSARRNGHASALLATLLSLKPAATLTLTVAASNDAAQALYDRFGFEEVRRLPGFFEGEPGLLLARRPGAE